MGVHNVVLLQALLTVRQCHTMFLIDGSMDSVWLVFISYKLDSDKRNIKFVAIL